MDSDDPSSERDRQRLYEKIGTNHTMCIASGRTDWWIFEGHHIAGRKFDGHVEYFSADIHRGFNVAQKSRPGPTCDSPGTVECAGHYDAGLADIFWPAGRFAENRGHDLVKLSESQDIKSEPAKAQIRVDGHYLGRFLGRVGPRLEHHGGRLIDEARKAQPRPAKRRRQHRKSGKRRAGPSRRTRP
jgi:hypothetical protein